MKVIVAHPQQQHSYRLATALKRSGDLAAYCTTVYHRPGSLTALLARFLPSAWKRKAVSRCCDELVDDEVYQFCEFGGLVVLLCRNISLFRRFYNRVRRETEDRFARRVALLARDIHADAVVGYDGVSAHLFEEVKRLSPSTVCIADMSAANALYLKDVYERDVLKQPAYSASLKRWNRIWDPIDIERTKLELSFVDRFLCGSRFVQGSLAYSGISQDRCYVCPYGVDTEQFPYRQRMVKGAETPLSFVYLGQVSEHKGIAYLIDAFTQISPEEASLLCVGEIGIPERIVSSLPENIILAGRMPHEEISSVLLESDVMLFPSLGDGFPLSLMEGMASGLPCVCTENTGTADCIMDGLNGFVIPVQDSGAMLDKIKWFIRHRDQIPAMAAEARNTVLNHTWSTYYECASKTIETMVEAEYGR